MARPDFANLVDELLRSAAEAVPPAQAEPADLATGSDDTIAEDESLRSVEAGAPPLLHKASCLLPLHPLVHLASPNLLRRLISSGRRALHFRLTESVWTRLRVRATMMGTTLMKATSAPFLIDRLSATSPLHTAPPSGDSWASQKRLPNPAITSPYTNASAFLRPPSMLFLLMKLTKC